MRVGVVGPGALGCLLAARLGLAGHEVWLVDHRPERAALLDRQGLVFTDLGGRTATVPVRATADPGWIDTLPLLFVCVKSQALRSVAVALRHRMGPDSVVIALQNGIAHHDALLATEPPWALGVTSQGATLDGPGRVRHGGDGPTWLGFLGPVRDETRRRLAEVAECLAQAGFAVSLCDDILTRAWNKLLVNVGINALTALLDCRNGELLERPAAMAEMTAAVQEAAMVAQAKGIAVAEDPLALTVEVCRKTRDNVSSMLQDVRAGRPTEIAAINGEIVRLADGLGLAVPVNRSLVTRVLALGGRYCFPDIPDSSLP